MSISPLEVARQEERGDDDAAEHVADDDLEEAEVAGEGQAGDGDDGEGGGFGGDDGERDGPPGNGVVGEEVALQRAIGCAAPRTLRKRRPKRVMPMR